MLKQIRKAWLAATAKVRAWRRSIAERKRVCEAALSCARRAGIENIKSVWVMHQDERRWIACAVSPGIYRDPHRRWYEVVRGSLKTRELTYEEVSAVCEVRRGR